MTVENACNALSRSARWYKYSRSVLMPSDEGRHKPRACRYPCRDRTAEFVREKLQRPAGLPGAAHFFVESPVAGGRDAPVE